MFNIFAERETSGLMITAEVSSDVEMRVVVKDRNKADTELVISVTPATWKEVFNHPFVYEDQGAWRQLVS